MVASTISESYWKAALRSRRKSADILMVTFDLESSKFFHPEFSDVCQFRFVFCFLFFNLFLNCCSRLSRSFFSRSMTDTYLLYIRSDISCELSFGQYINLYISFHLKVSLIFFLVNTNNWLEATVDGLSRRFSVPVVVNEFPVCWQVFFRYVSPHWYSAVVACKLKLKLPNLLTAQYEPISRNKEWYRVKQVWVDITFRTL